MAAALYSTSCKAKTRPLIHSGVCSCMDVCAGILIKASATPAMSITSATQISKMGFVFQLLGAIAFAASVKRGSSTVATASATAPVKTARDLPRRGRIRGINTEPPTRPIPAGAKTSAILFASSSSNFVTIGEASSPITSRSVPAKESCTTARKSFLLRRTKTQPWYISVHILLTISRFCVFLRFWEPRATWIKSLVGINAIRPVQTA